jgi:carbon-monoxide dehydrogenase medium subunit
MKLPPFHYAAPETLYDAVALLAEHAGEAKVLAGGQSLLPIMAFRLASPAMLIDIAGIPDLRSIRVEEDGLHLGPLVRWCDIERSAEIAAHQRTLRIIKCGTGAPSAARSPMRIPRPNFPALL